MKEDLKANISFSLLSQGLQRHSIFLFCPVLQALCILDGRGVNTSHLNLCHLSKLPGTVLFIMVTHCSQTLLSGSLVIFFSVPKDRKNNSY